jgi:hypothetical protein
MVSLVSTLAQDLQFVKNQLNKNVDNNLHYSSQIQMVNKVSDLISVSDGGDEENNDDDENDDDESDDDENDDNENDDDENDYDEHNTYIIDGEELNKYPFKNISLTNETSIKDKDTDKDNNLFDEIKTIHLENPISFEEINISLSNDKHNDLKVTSNDISFLKNVPMPNFENGENGEDLQGSYKKMPINKLREVIVGKGVVSDASKLKKTEILKMLEIDN